MLESSNPRHLKNVFIFKDRTFKKNNIERTRISMWLGRENDENVVRTRDWCGWPSSPRGLGRRLLESNYDFEQPKKQETQLCINRPILLKNLSFKILVICKTICCLTTSNSHNFANIILIFQNCLGFTVFLLKDLNLNSKFYKFKKW